MLYFDEINKKHMCYKCVMLAIFMTVPFLLLGFSQGENIFAGIRFDFRVIAILVFGGVAIGLATWDEKQMKELKKKREKETKE